MPDGTATKRDDFIAWVKARRDAVEVTEDALARAGELLGDNQRARAVHGQWVNDVVNDPTDDDALHAEAAEDPDSVFLAFVRRRVDDPYLVSYRAVDAARRKHEIDDAGQFALREWYQEIAWAEALMGSDDDEVATLMSLFLDAAKIDPSKAYLGVIAVYVGILEEDPSWATHPDRQLAPQDILAAGVDPEFVPLCLRFAKGEWGEAIASSPPAAIARRAEAARERHARLHRGARQRRALAEVASHPLSKRLTVVRRALRTGMSAADLLEAESRFMRAAATGQVDMEGVSAPEAFFDWLDAGSPPRARPATTQEDNLRRDEIANLGPVWLNESVPPDLHPGDGAKKQFRQWVAETADGKTDVSGDPVLDFCFWCARRAS